MKEPGKTCPNCGAPIIGENCEYCGAVFYDFSVIDVRDVSYVKIKVDGKILLFKAIVKSLDVTYES